MTCYRRYYPDDSEQGPLQSRRVHVQALGFDAAGDDIFSGTGGNGADIVFTPAGGAFPGFDTGRGSRSGQNKLQIFENLTVLFDDRDDGTTLTVRDSDDNTVATVRVPSGTVDAERDIVSVAIPLPMDAAELTA